MKLMSRDLRARWCDDIVRALRDSTESSMWCLHVGLAGAVCNDCTMLGGKVSPISCMQFCSTWVVLPACAAATPVGTVQAQ